MIPYQWPILGTIGSTVRGRGRVLGCSSDLLTTMDYYQFWYDLVIRPYIDTLGKPTKHDGFGS